MNDHDVFTREANERGCHAGDGDTDHDRPFAGFRSYQFNTLQLIRLLHLRGELLEARLGNGRWATDLACGS
jgi:hypothetical protein